MAEQKVMVQLDNFEQRILVGTMAEKRNDLIREDKPTEDVDEILLKLIDAPPVKRRGWGGRDER